MTIKSILDSDMPFASEARNKAVGADLPAEYHAWKKNPTPTNNTAFLKHLSPVIDSALTSYGMGNAASPVLRSRARVMALQAMRSYDPKKGNIRTHVLSHLRGLQRISGQQQQIISLPERVAIQRNQLIQAEDELRDRLGRDPSDLEIADATSLSPKRLAYLRLAIPPTAEGTLTQEDDEGNMQMPELGGGGQPHDAWADFVYYDLSPTDQLIMDYSLGRNGSPKLPLHDIARRLGITGGAVSQRAARIQTLLDERHTPIGGAGAR
jgi:RNA polymerase primary sigma factor